MIPSTLNDLDTARMFWEMARLAKEPVIQQLSKDIKAAKQHKPEWGRPIDKYIHDVVSPDYDSPVPPKGLIQTAIDSVQLPDRRKLTRPSCDTFRVILGLFRDPANLPMLVNTKTLSSCILLLREHTKDTDEPALCYEYGYLCFQVIVLTVQVAMLKRSNCSAFDTFMTMASKCPPAGLPELLSKHTMLQIHLHNHSDPSNNGLSWIVQVSRTPQGRITTLPNVGGMSELDSLFLIKTLWESRKQLSYLVSKAPMHGWAFPLRIFAELLLESFKISRNEATWGYLENLCHRYGLVASEEDLPVIAETCIIVGSICTDDHMREMSNGMKDEEDAQIVVESYIARMTLRPGVEPLPIAFCATLVDFVFREQVCFLGGILVPLIKVGYERIWQELADEKVARDADWGTNLARFIINTMGSTERLFGAEHRFRPTEIEAFVPPLHEIDIVGFLGQALLLPMNLPPDSQIDLYWAMLIKRVLFAGEYATWLNTLSHIRLQVLSNPDKDESLRANAQGAELAWVNVGKIFGFSDQARMGKSRKGLPETQAGVRHWSLDTVDSHRRICTRGK